MVSPQTGLEHDLAITPATTPATCWSWAADRLVSRRPGSWPSGATGSRCAKPASASAVCWSTPPSPIRSSTRIWDGSIHGVEQSGVTIELGAPVDPTAPPQGFDHVVVATGATWDAPEVPGDGPVLALADLRPWLVADDATVGDDVVILGGSKAALSLADLCRRRGRAVTVVAPERYVAESIGFPGRARLVADLEAAGVDLLLETAVEHVGDHEVRVVRDGTTSSIPASTVIGVEARTGPSPLAAAFAAAGLSTHVVGDADALAFISGATRGALDLALSLD